MTKSIRIREYISTMTKARRVAIAQTAEEVPVNIMRHGTYFVVDRQLYLQLLETLDDLTGIDTSVPNKITVKVPR